MTIDSTNKIVDVQNLTKKFKNITALDNVSFSIQKGEVFGLLGPNGAGKTTLIRLLLGLMRPTSGTAKVLGYDIKKNMMKIRRRASLLPQEASVYESLTAKENIMYHAQIYGGMEHDEVIRRTEEMIDLIGLRGRENDVTKEFSGGMKRKVLVARALVMDPELVFLDEPTTAIDILGARTVRTLIKRLSEEYNKTIVLTTHDLTEIELLCDRVGIMVRGKLAAIGRPDELEQKFKKAELEDVFIGLATGEGVGSEEYAHIDQKKGLLGKLLGR